MFLGCVVVNLGFKIYQNGHSCPHVTERNNNNINSNNNNNNFQNNLQP
jgi:hypothetical protein